MTFHTTACEISDRWSSGLIRSTVGVRRPPFQHQKIRSSDAFLVDHSTTSWLRASKPSAPRMYRSFFRQEFGCVHRLRGNPVDACCYRHCRLVLRKTSTDIEWAPLLQQYALLTLVGESPNIFIQASDGLWGSAGLKMPTHCFWRPILTCKVGQADLVFGVRPGFISWSVRARLQVTVCSGYDLCHTHARTCTLTHRHHFDQLI